MRKVDSVNFGWFGIELHKGKFIYYVSIFWGCFEPPSTSTYLFFTKRKGPSLGYVSIFWVFFWPTHPLCQHKCSTQRHKNGHFPNPPTQLFCWCNIEMVPKKRLPFSEPPTHPMSARNKWMIPSIDSSKMSQGKRWQCTGLRMRWWVVGSLDSYRLGWHRLWSFREQSIKYPMQWGQNYWVK